MPGGRTLCRVSPGRLLQNAALHVYSSIDPTTRSTSNGGLARTRAVSSSNSSLPGTGRVTPSNSSRRCTIKLHIHARHDQVRADGYEHATIELQPDSIGIELLSNPTPCVFGFIDLSSISISRTRRQSAAVPAAHLLQHGGVQPAEHIYTEPTCCNCIDIYTNLTHQSTPSDLHGDPSRNYINMYDYAGL